MFSLITLLHFPYPPIPQIGNEEPATDNDGAATSRRPWTYGHALMDDSRWAATDPELRRLIIGCLNEEPAQRPGLKEVMGKLGEKLGKDH